MDYAELYTEFREVCTDKIIVDRRDFCKMLKKANSGAIVEKDQDRYIFYYKKEIEDRPAEAQDIKYHLRIDSAVKVRFEGNFAQYNKLLNEIYSKLENKDNAKIYSKLRQGKANCNFFIMDVYYQM
ncbi:hypothetical protein D6856_10805 [Butyrivibrio sp. XB500-5]|uniref:DUF5975 family protein n=1 Tax=Butyrivibrio sp. XB500-5 TaxID=2364880 RepID=UPI000EA92018|nr:DUF5975 family protein [Butyrivibrio sp. XB500-5]RKM59694.1 hypothetical protein D6856_10805 [Butyrivibrio sp. XB500-5]